MFTPIVTEDGSCTFYSETFGEWFHSRQGACQEAQQTYVETVRLAQRAQALKPGEQLRILDVCYGLGYNSAAALETLWQVGWQAEFHCQVEIKALELDIEVPRSALAQGLIQSYSAPVQAVLKALAEEGRYRQGSLSAQLYLGDARQQIKPLIAQGWQADVVFLDPFSPPHCPELWTVEFLQQVAACLKPQGGELVTYSCAAAVRSALQQSALAIGSIRSAGRSWPGTLARPVSSAGNLAERYPLSPQEQEHLQTRAAVPYRDPTAQATADEILTRRSQEQAQSPLLPTGPWRKRWKAIALAEQ